MTWRKKIFFLVELPESSTENDKFDAYDIFMMLTIIVSIVPLAFKSSNFVFEIVDKVTVSIFIIDYILRWLTADYMLDKGKKSFFLYPFSFMAILDLITILPSLTIVNNGFKILKVVRLLRTLKTFRIFKAFRYSKNVQTIITVFNKQKESLSAVCILAIGYVLISAIVILNVEPDSFNNYFDALYWATVSLTTMGYGDIYPVTAAGRLITMISSFMGIAIVALPAGIITSGFVEELTHDKDMREEGQKSGIEIDRVGTLKVLIKNWMDKGKTVTEISELLECSEEDVKSLMEK